MEQPMGLIETDLDTQVTHVIAGAQDAVTRSLLDLEGGVEAEEGGGASAATRRRLQRPHKSMEFLLDKQNLRVVEPPENELQKGDHTRVMSEHQLRVQRSLQKLHVPDWYDPASVPASGFLLNAKSPTAASRWPAPSSSSTTSLGTLGLPSPSAPFVRWSTSKLATSAASSPCNSTRSSFNRSASPSSTRSSFSFRQPYLGWRSQERLARPRTPHERLANSALGGRSQEQIQSSIKEVTSAIVHYVAGLRPEEDEGSLRGSHQKLCWLESSFVGVRPVEAPQTPAQEHRGNELRLELHNDVNAVASNHRPNDAGAKPSPGSTTLEDVLDSLLGLPSSERAPSPSLQATASSANSEVTLACKYAKCGRTSSDVTTFKNCHNCSYTYCSRACRRAHWEKHRKTCLFSRIGTLCRHVIASIKNSPEALYHVSLVARRGYLSHGAGAVKLFFACPENAERFLEGHHQLLGEDTGELTYVRWPDLLPNEMGTRLYTELVSMCKSYNPECRLVLYVSVCVVSETPEVGKVKWERQLVSRCAKMRLSKDQTVRDVPPTLILTSPETSSMAERRRCVDNVHGVLASRGVSLRRRHPLIHRQLGAFAKGECDRLTPITVYPRDAATGGGFVCIIMLGVDAHSLRQVEEAGVKVRTVDVSREQD